MTKPTFKTFSAIESSTFWFYALLLCGTFIILPMLDVRGGAVKGLILGGLVGFFILEPLSRLCAGLGRIIMKALQPLPPTV